jgi:hypothetical protein
MRGGKRMATQLYCTTSIASTWNNAIHGILFSQHMTFSKLSCLTSKRKPKLINISGVDWPTSKLNHSNQQMCYKSCSLKSILGFAMMIGLKMTDISSEYYTTAIFSYVSHSFCQMSHIVRTGILNWCASLTLRVAESTAR